MVTFVHGAKLLAFVVIVIIFWAVYLKVSKDKAESRLPSKSGTNQVVSDPDQGNP